MSVDVGCILGQKTCFYAIYWMYVFHAIQNYSPDFLQVLVWAHNTDSIPLDEDITLSQQFNGLVHKVDQMVQDSPHDAYLERAPIGPNDPLSPFYESLLIPHEGPNLDNIARDIVVQDFDSLGDCDASGEKFYHVACFKDDVGVVCFSGCADGHRAVYEIKSAGDTLAV
jgi:hypothetical protein